MPAASMPVHYRVRYTHLSQIKSHQHIGARVMKFVNSFMRMCTNAESHLVFENRQFKRIIQLSQPRAQPC